MSRQWLVVALALLVGLGAGYLATPRLPGGLGTTAPRATTGESRTVGRSAGEMVLRDVRPSVARINSNEGSLLGSGFYLGEGYILTGEHVVAGRSTLRVTGNLGTLSGKATVVGWDTALDVALLRLAQHWDIRGLPLYRGGLAEVGEEVVLLGYPLSSEDTPSASRGIVSRYLSRGRGGWVLETDAASNPGSSGGPLVDSRGLVVGILQSVPVGREEGLARAQSMEEILAILDRLKDGSRR